MYNYGEFCYWDYSVSFDLLPHKLVVFVSRSLDFPTVMGDTLYKI